MIDRVQQMAATLDELRREFDEAFARAPSLPGVAGGAHNMLAVRVGGEPFAIPVAQIEGMFADRRVVPLPTPLPELLGVANFRGRVAPVYDLAAFLLGSAARGPLRWLVLVRGRAAFGLAFDAFEGQLSVPPESLSTGAPGREAVCLDGTVRSVVHLPSVAQEIQKRVDGARHLREKRR
jgi:purine-binding chemotaxis protein CheW